MNDPKLKPGVFVVTDDLAPDGDNITGIVISVNSSAESVDIKTTWDERTVLLGEIDFADEEPEHSIPVGIDDPRLREGVEVEAHVSPGNRPTGFVSAINYASDEVEVRTQDGEVVTVSIEDIRFF